jgi:hypothetical protein
MSKRSMKDYIHDAFFARDKASLAAIVKDAEEAEAAEPEPDGDEGDGSKVGGVHVHISHGGESGGNGGEKGIGGATGDNGEDTEKRLKGVEDGLRSLDGKMTRLFDHLKIKDANGDGDGDDEDDEDDKEKPPPTGDQTGEEGAQTAEKLAAAEPDLMEADPALKTGRSMMGDAAYRERVTRLVPVLVQDMRARAEILVPGTPMPTFDAATPGKATQAHICGYRRSVLMQAVTTEKGAKAVAGGYTADAIKGMSCDAVRMLFNDASERMRAANNATTHVHNPTIWRMPDQAGYRNAQAQRLAAINKGNSEFWARQTGRSN